MAILTVLSHHINIKLILEQQSVCLSVFPKKISAILGKMYIKNFQKISNTHNFSKKNLIFIKMARMCSQWHTMIEYGEN